MNSPVSKFVTMLVPLVWTAVIVGLLAWDQDTQQRHAEELAKKEACSNFNKDQAFRMWATRHGGVYVPADERTPPNPGLAHLPERDIKTPSGKKLTLMNPAYILRQMMSEYGDLYGIRGKITSLKLINPNNAPDDWEAAALRRFDRGDKEALEFTELEGKPYLRLMRPMPVVAGCLKCHAFQGYKVGDVRGGVGVAVPMQPYLDDLSAGIRPRREILGVLWLTGLIAIAALVMQVRRRVEEQARATADAQQQGRFIARASQELQRFAEVTAHHLQEPARRIASYADRLTEQLGEQLEDAEARLSLEFIGQQARRQQNLLRDVERYLAADQPRGEADSADAGEVVGKVLQHFHERIASVGAAVTVGPLPPARIDAPRLSDLFAVVLDNALKYAQGEGPLRIAVEGERLGAQVRYSVSDNGAGIEAQYRERVFRLFERLTSGHDVPDAGTGLGLAIVRRIAEACGGRAWIEEAPGGGCRVLFELRAGEKS
jgi:signal transduction histidine kinase